MSFVKFDKDFTKNPIWHTFPESKKRKLINILENSNTLTILESKNLSQREDELGEYATLIDNRINREREAWKILKEHFSLKIEEEYISEDRVKSDIKDGKSFFGDDIEKFKKSYTVFKAANQIALSKSVTERKY